MCFFMWYVDHALGIRRCYYVESTSTTLIQRRNNVVYPVVSSWVGAKIAVQWYAPQGGENNINILMDSIQQLAREVDPMLI